MKLKLLLLLSVLGSVAVANAQFTVTDKAGNVINDGDIIQFGTVAFPEASLDFFVTNDNPSSEIYTRVVYESESNSTNGEFEQLCYGLCYNDLVPGESVPPTGDDSLIIGIGETTLMGNHFWNDDPGNGTDNVDFIFRFVQYDDVEGTVESGISVTFTYRYNPTLSVPENNKVDLTIQSTIVSSELVLNVNEPVSMLVYDLQGRVVKQANFEAGHQTVAMSDLSSQMYIVQFTNDKGASQTTKIIVQ